ncbi:acyl-CoA dehydrogenase family protein [Dyadobacter alkalitolerans]|uniref:acyl-CoA dehydrogenase family protein n=1 Tax=Dyadobacter alkalitolerans TaxID=492736 RepID=UPI00040EC808|nr:acyl-CoA dehydrogenase family protein [Dyadobacter alkalitolerans]
MDLSTIVDKAREIAHEVTLNEVVTADSQGVWVQKTMEALMQSKLTGLVAPSDCGGMGHGLFALTRVCEELGKAYASAGLCFGMHCVGTAVIASKATQWQKESYLQPIAEGKHLTTLALSEPGTGSHFYFPQTALLALSEDEFIITGGKSFVTNGGRAHSYVISTMAASEDAGPGQFSCAILDENSLGMQWGKKWDGLGMRGNSSISLNLNNIHITSKHILGQKGDQLWYVFNVVAPYFLMAMAGTYLGIAESAIQEAKSVLLTRHYTFNGSSLSHVSILQHRLGTLWAKVESTRRLIYSAAMGGDSGATDAVLSILAAKAEVAKCAVDTVNEAMTIAGGIGYQQNARLGLLLRDARAADVMSPTTDLLYTWIGRSLLDLPLLSE